MMTIFKTLIVIGLISGLIACSVTSPTPRLYLLQAVEERSAGVRDTSPTIIVGPITLPEHLNRKGILTRTEQYEAEVAEFDRWAEPLEYNITSTITKNLAAMVPSEHVINYPSDLNSRADFTIRAQILAFGTEPNNDVILDVIWEITDGSGAVIELKNTQYSQVRHTDDMPSTVAAMSYVLGQFSRDIAAVLQQYTAR